MLTEAERAFERHVWPEAVRDRPDWRIVLKDGSECPITPETDRLEAIEAVLMNVTSSLRGIITDTRHLRLSRMQAALCHALRSVTDAGGEARFIINTQKLQSDVEVWRHAFPAAVRWALHCRSLQPVSPLLIADDWLGYEEAPDGSGSELFADRNGATNVTRLQHEFDDAWMNATGEMTPEQFEVQQAKLREDERRSRAVWRRETWRTWWELLRQL